ncbi:hypothetical protein [Dysgonomonas sp. 216]|uniref:hypothetical protein n=1 Tax=Dysgonomonas sp. 216 TaxID=2302934 RepID=UPI0013CFC87F|nr:hypothetical protein [Dysgonomonas sp. 216]
MCFLLLFSCNNEIDLQVERNLGLAGNNRADFENKLAKVFRKTYEKHSESLYIQPDKDGDIPYLFNTPCIEDVTDQYQDVSDVEIDINLKSCLLYRQDLTY